MGELTILYDLVVIFAVAVAAVALLRRVGVPPIAGFILAGALLGPRSFGLIQDVERVDVLAEIGVVLLLFGIGLEISLGRLRRLWRPIVFGGALQVGITVLATASLARLFGQPVGTSVFLGCLVAVSSTAIVLRGLEARGELEAPHGRLTLGILVFQDLSVVPMMLAIPLFAGQGATGWNLAGAMLKAAAVLAGVLFAARLLVPRALGWIAGTRQRDLFVLTVFLVCIGTAWAASTAGVSLALGAFLGGLVVAGSEYRHQALADLIPFREVLTSVFFVSVGMLLDPEVIWGNVGPILLLLVGILAGKFAVVFAAAAVLRLPLRVCVLAAAALAQVGEFSFVLARAAGGTGLLAGWLESNLFAAVILSMLVSPLGLALGPHLAAGIGKIRMLTLLLRVRTAEDAVKRVRTWHDHVIIAGYGVAGQELARSLRECGVPYVIADLNPHNVRQAAAQGEPAYFGDVTSPEVLELLGAAHARELVLVINDPTAAERAAGAARRVAPNLYILVRSRYLSDLPSLVRAGANRVIPAELEAAVEVVAHVLGRHGCGGDQVADRLSRVRRRREERL
ncbi:MAG: cation:proton antiporter [Candidatus Tectomicrobia bacterium]|nr:cation:proton antiporter [Candidatus Tectomicrobia bacterium]